MSPRQAYAKRHVCLLLPMVCDAGKVCALELPATARELAVVKGGRQNLKVSDS